VNLPGIAECKKCHGPQRTDNGQLLGGIRADCTGCHSYHHGTQPLLGPGAVIYDPKEKMNTNQFLNFGR
jgi:hypothetical protein